MSNYPSNLTDNQWNLIKDFLPETKNGGYQRKHSRREMLNAIFYINKTGCQWRYLPGPEYFSRIYFSALEGQFCL